MTYDLANRLKTHAAGSTTTTYTYDGDGGRRQASSGSQASKKTNFFWDVNHALPQAAIERDGNNALLRRYAYGHRRISMTSSGAASYYHYDAIGSVANLTSSAGATQWTWAYEPFGAIRTETKASGTQPTNFMKFAGEYLDPTGLYHLRARQYDPARGRFMQRDPAEPDSGSPLLSSYVYAANRPTVYVDPSGATYQSDSGEQQKTTRVLMSSAHPSAGEACKGRGKEDVFVTLFRYPLRGRSKVHPVDLKCGAHYGPHNGFGVRHIEAEKHFGGRLTDGAIWFIGGTMIHPDVRITQGEERKSRFTYEASWHHPYFRYTFNVRVAVETLRKSVVTAFIRGKMDKECCWVLKVGPNGIGPALESP
jgi:RHS repeat-associated protein